MSAIDDAMDDLEDVCGRVARDDRRRLCRAALTVLALQPGVYWGDEQRLACERLVDAASSNGLEVAAFYRKLRQIVAVRGWGADARNPADVSDEGGRLGWGAAAETLCPDETRLLNQTFLERATGLGERRPEE